MTNIVDMKASRLPETPYVTGIDKNSSESEIAKFIKKAIKTKPDQVEKAKVIEELAEKSALGKRAINAMWKGAQRAANKPKGIAGAKFFPDVNDDFHDNVDYLRARIKMVNEQKTRLCQRAGEMVTIDMDAEGRAFISVKTLDGFKHFVNEISKWKKTEISNDTEIDKGVPAPNDAVSHIYHGTRSNLPPLNRLTTVKTFTKDGVLTREGYSEGIYYDPLPDFDIPQVPKTPDEELVKECILALIDVIADFSLDGLARKQLIAAFENSEDLPSLAHALSYMLSSVVREMINGPCPGHLARKDRPRSGASLLIAILEQIATAQRWNPMTLPGNEDEIRKTLHAAFIEGSPYIAIDNLSAGKEVDSDVLASAMTAFPTFKARFLGATAMVPAPARAIFGFTGNRSALGSQLAERMLLIDLAPGVENPGDRPPSTFKHDLETYVPKHASHLY